MSVSAEGRTTRLTAVGRFRQERLGRRAADLDERMGMIQDVAARVLELVADTQHHMTHLRTTRAIEARELHAALDAFRAKLAEAGAADLNALQVERRDMSQGLHGTLDQFRADLLADVEGFLATTRSDRAAAAAALGDALAAFMSALRDEDASRQAQANADREDRLAFLGKLREDVLNILTEDF